MKILGIDTTRKSAKIYIANDDSNYVENIDDKIKHSEGLFLYLEKSLLINKLELKQVVQVSINLVPQRDTFRNF